jgi:EAL domain-containing protein (putative c-di-GMP-specific phosphodiesterase class I)
MAIVRDYCNNPDKLLPSVIQTFKIMGFTVTAEGIETEEMADAMYKIGCDYLQGYLFSPPVPIEEFADILK